MLTNKDFAKENKVFIKACELAGVEPTSRQASKFRNRTGKTNMFYNKARELININNLKNAIEEEIMRELVEPVAQAPALERENGTSN